MANSIPTIFKYSQSNLPIFEGEHYDYWSLEMKDTFIAEDLWEVVENGYAQPSGDSSRWTEEQQKQDRESKKKNAAALRYIKQAVGKTIYPRIFNKVFNVRMEGTLQTFDRECEILRNIRHRNLIKIISSCCNLDFKALVLEYMPNESLDKFLYCRDNSSNILQRLNIMVDVASALEYLHHGYPVPIIHCDLKPSNVLLDKDMVGHLSDFGIAKFLTKEESIAHTTTLATIGYIAPEYGLEGLVSTRSDVYSYGIMLMEYFTRKKPNDEIFLGDLDLRSFVHSALPDKLDQIIDVDLLTVDEENLSEKLQCVLSIMELAMICTAKFPIERMNMTDVVAALKKIKQRLSSHY